MLPAPASALRLLAVFGIWVTAAALISGPIGSRLEIGIVTGGAIALISALAMFDGGSMVRRLDLRSSSAKDEELPMPEYAQHFLAMEYAAALRGRELTLVVFGFDHFEEFTNKNGNAAADAAVQEFGAILARMTRRMNLSARYGWRGDTFLSVLSDADSAGAEVFIRRILSTVAESTLITPMPSISAGVAEFESSMRGPEVFVQLAEQALGQARAEGGNCVRIHASNTRPADRPRWLQPQ